jgi:hypothetical protein
MDKSLLLAYLDGRRRPIAADPAATARHRALLDEAPGFYLDLLADTTADVSHRREVLANLLIGPASAPVDRDAVLLRLRAQPDGEALQVLEAVRRVRRNGRRARGLGLAFLLGHERLAELAAGHRGRLVRLLKHLLGERTWASVARALRKGAVSDRPPSRPAGLLSRLFGREAPRAPADPEAFLRRTVLRYARDPATAREALLVLAGDAAFEPAEPSLARRQEARRDLARGAGLPRETLFGLRGTFHPKVPAGRVRALAAAAAAADVPQPDGPITGLFKRSLVAGCEPAARAAVSEGVAEAAGAWPTVDASLAVVVDLSGSAASSGERANHPAALGLALTALLRDRVREVRLHQVGGTALVNGSALAHPAGETDLASAVLDAARGRPGTILVVSDGYENVRPGDTAAVVDGLRRLGVTTPVYQVVPLFAAGEDLGRRRLGGSIPVLAVRHEREVGELLARVFLAHAPDKLSDDDVNRLGRLLFRR